MSRPLWQGCPRLPRTRAPDDAHQELAEAIVQFLDVSQRAHGRMVVRAGAAVYAVLGRPRHWIPDLPISAPRAHAYWGGPGAKA